MFVRFFQLLRFESEFTRTPMCLMFERRRLALLFKKSGSTSNGKAHTLLLHAFEGLEDRAFGRCCDKVEPKSRVIYSCFPVTRTNTYNVN